MGEGWMEWDYGLWAILLDDECRRHHRWRERILRRGEEDPTPLVLSFQLRLISLW